MTARLICGGHVVDPASGFDGVADLLIENGRISAVLHPGERLPHPGDEVLDATGKIVCPGLIDIHVAFREPGDEEDETTESGSRAALAGGFTTVACLPDTSPAIDTRASAEFLKLQGERAGNCRVLPIGAVTKNTDGVELAEIGQLVDGGAVALSDGKKPIANAEIMRRALQYAGMFDRAIFNHPQVPELVVGGVMHEGYHSTLLGLRGMPAAAEHIMVNRDISLAELTGGRLHLMCVTTAASVELIRRAKAAGVRVSADTSPHHLALTDAALRSFDSSFKVDPPLRSEEHVVALIEGLKDGTVEIISSDHQPFSDEKKAGEILSDPAGAVGLETLLPVCISTLIEPGHLTWRQLIATLTMNPARLLGLDAGTLTAGATADVTIIDPNAEWTIDPRAFRSRGRNTPFAGWHVKGRVEVTLVAGEIRYAAQNPRW
ncbi:MAG: dihydroorotase [Planctomycetaceae bacterium]